MQLPNHAQNKTVQLVPVVIQVLGMKL